MLPPSWDARRVVCDGFLPRCLLCCQCHSLFLVLSSRSLQLGHHHVGLIAHMLLNHRSLHLRLAVDWLPLLLMF